MRQKEMKSVVDLICLQQQVNSGDPKAISAAINNILSNMIPLSDITASISDPSQGTKKFDTPSAPPNKSE
jgi:hypothetical protein